MGGAQSVAQCDWDNGASPPSPGGGLCFPLSAQKGRQATTRFRCLRTRF